MYLIVLPSVVQWEHHTVDIQLLGDNMSDTMFCAHMALK